MSKPKSAEEQAAIATLKELRARDAALATREYEQETLATRARTEKLRAMRLARDQKAAQNPAPAAPPKKAAAKMPGVRIAKGRST